MDRKRLEGYRREIRAQLGSCIDFWLKNGMDAECGGVLTCLDRRGEVFSGDKSVWMQGRCAWTFARLCSLYGARDEWLRASKSCIDFLESHCVNRAQGGRLYFTVTREGRPLRQRRYCFSEGFAALANAEYAAVTGDAGALDRARRYYDMVWMLNNGGPDPVGMPPKTDPEVRPMRALADPMIYLNMTSVLRRVDPEREAEYAKRAEACVRQIVGLHMKPDLGCTLETVAPNGDALLDTVAGRVVNPGHDIECSWFLLEQAGRTGDAGLRGMAAKMFDMAVEMGWDEEYGGLKYFVDCLGRPPEAYEHDMKLWWPHTEMLIAALMLYRDTGEKRYAEWFARAWDYSMAVFPDREYGEWYGYLRRDGKSTEPACKGSTFKGPFHYPRMLMMVDQMLGGLLDREEGGHEDGSGSN